LRGRDLAIILAVVLLAGFAVADALRSRSQEAEPTTSETSAPESGPRPQAEAPPGWPQGLLQGTLVFTDAEDCRVRVIGLAGGRERPVGTVLSDCRLWAAPVSQRIAYGTGSDSFRFIDLIDTDRALGEFDGPLRQVLWSADGQRAAWCTSSEVGFEIDAGELTPHLLRRCPVAYAPGGRPAFAVGRRLIVEGRTVLRVGGAITFARWGVDGSISVAVDGRRLERYEGGRLTGALEVPEAEVAGADPVLSPDNCAVAVEVDPSRIRIGDLGCFAGGPTTIFGSAAAWSPDGNWIAVSEVDRVEFHRLVPPGRVLAYPVRAPALAWRGR
jgi:hypothetical protein